MKVLRGKIQCFQLRKIHQVEPIEIVQSHNTFIHSQVVIVDICTSFKIVSFIRSHPTYLYIYSSLRHVTYLLIIHV